MCDLEAASLSNRKKVSLGTQPIVLETFSTNGTQHVFAAVSVCVCVCVCVCMFMFVIVFAGVCAGVWAGLQQEASFPAP